MGRATKKGLNEALKPLFTAYDRYALGLTSSSAPPVARPTPIEWRGLSIDIAVVRRARPVCGVPFPFALFEFWYEATRDGERIVQSSGGRPTFIDAVFGYHRRKGIEL